MTCIFVIDGVEVYREDRDEHPGMEAIELTWTHKTPLRVNPNLPDQSKKFKETQKTGTFYWDHMDARRNHVFKSERV